MRNSCLEEFCKNGVLEFLANFIGKHLCQSLVFCNDSGIRPAAILKRDSGAGVFLRILRIFEEHFFYVKHIWRLLLDNESSSRFISAEIFCFIFFGIIISQRLKKAQAS